MKLDIPEPSVFIDQRREQQQLSYRIKRDVSPLGRGGYSMVFIAEDFKTNQLVALKKSRVPLKVKRPMLQHEVWILQMLQGHPAIPEVYGYGQLEHFEYISMEILGPSVKEKVVYNRGLSLLTVVRVVKQALSALKHIHEHGIVHRDIKPDNLLCSNKDSSKILLIDFGIAKRRGSGPPRKYDPLKDKKHIRGTVYWASLNSHRGIDLGPGDDLESLAYTALFLLRGNLPWRDDPMMNRRESVLQSQARVFKSKSTISSSELVMQDSSKEEAKKDFAYLLDYSRQLQYHDIPDYHLLENRFSVLGESLGVYKEGDPLDWTPSNTSTNNGQIGPMPDEEDDGEDYEEKEDEYDSHDNSYFDWDIDCWDDIHKSRALSLTLPVEVEELVDSQIPRIVEVTRA